MSAIDLRVLEKGIQLLITNKFNQVVAHSENAPEIQSKMITVIARAFGETLDRLECPVAWRRFIQRKDCPKYMKEIVVYEINAYYPKIQLSEEEHYLNIDNVKSYIADEEVK